MNEWDILQGLESKFSGEGETILIVGPYLPASLLYFLLLNSSSAKIFVYLNCRVIFLHTQTPKKKKLMLGDVNERSGCEI